MINARNTKYHELRIFLTIVFLLVTIGCVFIYSASSIYALEHYGSAHYFVMRQFIGLAIGLIAIIALQFISTDHIKKLSPYLFWGSLALTALTLIPTFSRTIHGAHRWVNIAGITFQPSELLKCTLIIYLAYLLTKHDWSLSMKLCDYFRPLVVLGLSCLIVLKQPDFGLTVTITIAAIAMLFINHMRVKYLLLLVATILPAGIFLMITKAYRLRRILVFLNPWEDPRGSGFQIIQSLIAIGAGNWFGVGIGHSKQKFFYLPMQHTDFVFSVIAEEIGFIGVMLIIALFLALLYLGMRIASNLSNPFSSLMITGISILISLQAMINLAVVSGLVPTKGIGLPFISYGNSALICNLMMIGIVINCVRDES